MLLSSSFFLTLLENYGLQLHHLTLHTIALVSIIIHLCEMYVGVRPSVHLFWLFFALYASRRSSSHLGAYYFQHSGKSSVAYITPLSHSKWDHRSFTEYPSGSAIAASPHRWLVCQD
jgi:hypothetical protein